jgi:hypothetical protein
MLYKLCRLKRISINYKINDRCTSLWRKASTMATLETFYCSISIHNQHTLVEELITKQTMYVSSYLPPLLSNLTIHLIGCKNEAQTQILENEKVLMLDIHTFLSRSGRLTYIHNCSWQYNAS